jgi:HJR/Mrr/RecB family endonuclease
MNYFSDNQSNVIVDIIGASRSIEILINDNDFDLLNQIYDLTLLSDQRLKLCILISANKKKSNAPLFQSEGILENLAENCWEIYETQTKYSTNALIIDKKTLYLFLRSADGSFIEKIEDNRIKEEILYLLQLSKHNSSNVRLLFEDILSSSFRRNTSGIVTISRETWAEIIAKFAENPKALARLSSREFEELIAELLVRENMKVHLTKQTRDGGVDIFAEKETIFGRHLYLVECKHNNKENKVGVSIVRALYGVVEDKNATKGIIVTTSDFTRDVKSFADLHRNRINLINYDSLVTWLEKRGQNND